MEFKRIAVDTSKHVFTLHGVDQEGRCVLRRTLSRAQFEAFIARQEATEFVLEACGSSHHWGRQLSQFGHQVRLIPPQYVRPFVKRGKNDRTDAAAIAEAADRPEMRVVPVKSAEQQAEAMLLKVRETLVEIRTKLINAVRGHAAEFGVIAAKGTGHVTGLLEAVKQSAMPEAGKQGIALYGQEIATLQTLLAEIERKLLARFNASPAAKRLAEVPGVGVLTALSLTLTVDARQFSSGRHFAAWLGLTPQEHSTGGKTRLGGISRAGNERLRQLLVVGATSVIRHAKPGKPGVWAWLLELLERRPRKVAAVALANKMARILWAMMVREEAYRPPQAAA